MKKVLLTFAMAVLLPFALHAQITTFPWEESFENGTTGWTIIDSDNDGICWQLSDTSSQIANFSANYPRTGTACIIALSYNNLTYQALTPDEWLISPALQIPAGSNFYLTFYDNGTNAQYAAEHYAVHVANAATVAALSATPALMEQTLSVGEWIKRTVDLSAYAGQTIYIGFHHFDCTDQFCLGIDDIRVGGAESPELTLDGPTAVRVNDEATFTAISSNATSYAWTVDGTAVNNNTNTLTTTFTTLGNHTVIAAATNAAGTTIDSLTVNVFSCDAITTFPYVADFTNGFGCWDTINSDLYGIGQWMLVNEEADVDGQVASMSGYYYNQQMYDLGVDNWLYSPVMTMPANGALEVAYDALALGAQYGYAPEHYGVYVIQNETETLLYEEDLEEEESVERNVYIPASVTGSFRIAFRHFNTTNGYILVLDNIQVRTQTATNPTVALDGPLSIMLGDEATYTASVNNATSFTWSIDGAAVSETSNTLTHTFTTPGDHTVSITATNAYGNATANFTTNVYSCNPIAQFPYNESFEGDGLGCWTLISNNTENNARTGIFDANDDAVDGNRYFHFSSYSSADDYTQYLITPELNLAAGTSYHISFWYKAYSANYEEDFAVLSSTTGKNVTDFTNVMEEVEEAPAEWTEMNLNIPAGTKYIAIKYYSDYAWYLYIDDVTIAEGNGIADIDDSRVSLYPNPASNMVRINATGIEGNKTIAIVDLNGRTVMEQKGNAQSFTFDVTNIARGAYFVRMTGENVNAVRKLIVK